MVMIKGARQEIGIGAKTLAHKASDAGILAS
jgi:hypothetical protein